MSIIGVITDEGSSNAQEAASNQGFQFTPINFSISDIAGTIDVSRTFASKNTTWYSAVISGFTIIDANNVELNLTIPPSASVVNKEIAEIYIEAEDQFSSPVLLALGQPETQLIYDISGATVLRMILQITNLPISGIFTFQYTQAVEIQAHETSPTHHPLNKLDGVTNPLPTDDASIGYSRGSLWVNVAKNTFFICVNAAVGAAVWTSGASSGTRLYYNTLGTGVQTVFDNSDLSPSGFSYTVGNGSLEVYIDGIHQGASSYTEIDSTSFSLLVAPPLNSTIDVVVTDTIQISNANTMLEFESTGTGSKTVYNASDLSPSGFIYTPGAGQLIVLVGNVPQPQSTYTQVNSTSIQFTQAPASGAPIRIIVFSLVGIANAYDTEEIDNIISGNPLVNGTLEVWPEGVSRSNVSSGDYLSAQSLLLSDVSSFTINATREAFSLGQVEVPQNPEYYMRIDQTVTGSGGTFHDIVFLIEGVESFSNKLCLISFYAKMNIESIVSVLVEQNFGTGGSPSTSVNSNTVSILTQTSWTLHKCNIQLPSVTGKTLGTNNDDHLKIRIRLPFNVIQTLDLALLQFKVGRIHTPFEFVSKDRNLRDCLRYYEQLTLLFSGDVTSSSTYYTLGTYLVQKVNTPSLSFTDVSNNNFPSASESIVSSNLDGCQISVVANGTGAGNFSRIVTANSRLV